MIFSVPNLELYLKKKYSNVINFEHTYLLTETMMDFLLQKHGFVILEKKLFENHSIFYATEKGIPSSVITIPDRYMEYKKLYKDMITYYKNEAAKFNDLMKDVEGPVYLFGAHIFSQFLIYWGLGSRDKKIDCIIDNSELKQGKRLYGSELFVKSPNIIKNQRKACVILKAGQYQDEIREQLIRLNSKIMIFE
jgi:hypothetical protein